MQQRSKVWPNHLVWEPGKDDRTKAAAYQTPEDVFVAISRLLGRTRPRFVWCGHANIDWPLTPTLHRMLSRGGEPPQPGSPDFSDWVISEQKELLNRARALDFVVERTPSDGNELTLRDLALLQHHGAATGLLDVTADPFVALYFAALPTGDNDHGALVAIDASPAANRPSAVEFDLTTRKTFDRLIEELAGDAMTSFGLYRPPAFTPRIAVQRSLFIFSDPVNERHGTVQLGQMPSLEDSEKRLARIFDGNRQSGHTATLPITVIKISRKVKGQLLDYLNKRMGISEETLFPDLDGFARSRGWTRTPLTNRPKGATIRGQGAGAAIGTGTLGVQVLGA